MSKGKHDAVPLPNDCWEALLALLRRRGMTLESLGAQEHAPSIKTLRRGMKAPRPTLTLRAFDRLASALTMTPGSLLAQLDPTTKSPAGGPLTTAASTDLDAKFRDLARGGRYDDCAALAAEALSRADQSREAHLIAHWSDRCADAYRASGRLREASEYYHRAWTANLMADHAHPGDPTSMLQAAKIRFGMVMVDDYMIRGAFRQAYSAHASLIVDADRIIADAGASRIHSEIRERRPHLRRQQAEMLRLLGNYEAALSLIVEVKQEYPVPMLEARLWCDMVEGDSLRLLGRLNEALAVYDEVRQYAELRNMPGLLGAVLLRRARALDAESMTVPSAEASDLKEDSRSCVAQALAIAELQPDRYRYMRLYALLALASYPYGGGRAVAASCDGLISMFGLSRTYLSLEWAHVALCRAEALRGHAQRQDAVRWFKAAYEAYYNMECRWGTIRAWMGLELCGGSTRLPSEVSDAAEGADRDLLRLYSKGSLPVGLLAVNWP